MDAQNMADASSRRAGSSGAGWWRPGTVDAALKKLVTGRKTQDNVIKGRRIVDYLCAQTVAKADVLYSLASQFELTYGQLRGRAIQDAAAEGIPFRMWSRLDEQEISDRLSLQAHRAVQREVGDLESVFQEAGIQLATLDPSRTAPVWSLMRTIMAHVFLDLGDCTVYAHALLAEASGVITADGYFGDVVAGIANPGAGVGGQNAQERFRRAKAALTKFLALEIGIDPKDVQLPKSIRI